MIRFSANRLVKNLWFGLLAVSLAILSLGMAVTTTVYAASTAVPPSPVAVAHASTGNISAAEQQAVALMNADRSAQGLPALAVDSRLTNLGEKYAQDMIKRKFFSHTNPEGQSPFDRMKQAGISYSYAGENIAINQSVPAAETAFMNSPDHRANILNTNYSNTGIGVAYDKSGDVYVVQEFIKP